MKTVFFDVDTQLDFLLPAGALYVPGAEALAVSLAELARFAAGRQIQVISTADAHTGNDPEFLQWKPHCVAGTFGQQKLSSTLLPKALTLSTKAGALANLRPQAASTPQIVVEKQQLDCFTNPNLRPLLGMLAADRYVVYGVVTELCVQCASFGLLESGARVELVTDAIKALNSLEEQLTLQRFQEKGGTLTTVAQITSRPG